MKLSYLLLGLISFGAFGAEIHTVAGTGTKGFSGDGGPAAQAQMNNVYGLVRGPDGALYVCDTDNQRLRRIAPDGTISTFAGSGRKGFSGDGGKATDAEMNEPYEVRFDAMGNCFVVERMNHCVRRINAKSGVISTVAGTGGKSGFGGDGGPAVEALLSEPHSIQFDRTGNLYICDIRNHRVRRVDMKTGIITTFAGTGESKPTPDGAKIAGTPLKGPRALDLDAAGNLWLALREGNAIYKLDLRAGTLHHVAGAGGKPGFAGNGGPAKDAVLGGPKGISVAPNGDVYFADTESHSIRRIDMKKGTVELVAGTGARGDGPEPTPAECKLSRPHGIFVDKDGTVFIGDSEAHRVRVISAAQIRK
jgi:streptogramin lyase